MMHKENSPPQFICPAMKINNYASSSQKMTFPHVSLNMLTKFPCLQCVTNQINQI